MRVLFVTHIPTMSGANRSVFQLIKELKEDYHVEPFVLAPTTDRDEGTIHQALKKIGVPLIEAEIRYFKVNKPTLRNIVGYMLYLWRNRNLYKKLKKNNFDIVHSNTSVIDIGAYLSRQLKTKHVWHLREFGDKDYNLHPIGGKLYECFTYRHADAYIAISKIIAEYFSSTVNRQRLHTIYNGIYKDDKIGISLHKNTITQFFVAGIISEVKNQKEIIMAVDELVHGRGVKAIHLTLVGIHIEPYTQEIFAMIKDRGLNDYVTILPEIDGIQSIATQMDVGIMSSRAEAFGRVTIEYQLYNLLVIANDAGANPELIDDNVTGLLYKAGEYLQLADKIQQVIENPKMMTSLASAGREHAQQNFLSVYNTKAIFRLYQELLAHGSK